ncbi:MAG TPA: UvrD-helicase domain-containing protein, partial [Bacillota bacterium]|nr:UvrD-helicase domain-containing protein [Bacillota bacterium]
MDLLDGLNPQQKKAVTTTEGPLLVLAGAGSGKTRVLTHRIAYLIKEKGVYPGSILAITFTNKAAGEMKERVLGLLGEENHFLWVSTFHSACVRILRADAEKIGYGRNFVIYDTSDQLMVVKDCLRELDINERDFSPKKVLEVIGRAKDNLQSPGEFIAAAGDSFAAERIGWVYRLYQKKLKSNNAMDFDDLILKTVDLFNEHPEVLSFYQDKFRYILVDEYQDTNTPQYRLVHLLSQAHRNLCVVGDDDQSIYKFRGANIENILNFELDFPEATVIKLEQNYRSTGNILEAANRVIANNSRRKKKRLWTKRMEGYRLRCGCAVTERHEAELVVSEALRLCADEERKLPDMAVLYRTNAQSRVLEEAFVTRGVPYKVVGSLAFYQRKEIKDLLAYLRVIVN